MSEDSAPSRDDLGAAMMAWYAEAIRRFPEGLVSQAQAAAMLNVSRMTVSRLVARGYLRAVYFPHPPDLAGMPVGREDPTWLRIAGWLGLDPDGPDPPAMPRACYVSFADVVELWRRRRSGGGKAESWAGILADLGLIGGARPRTEVAGQEASEAPGETSGEDEELETWML